MPTIETFILHDKGLAEEKHTGVIRVLLPCECEPCASGKRWFYCRNLHPTDRRTIAFYRTPPADYDFDGCTEPSQTGVAIVRQLHPGMTLLYGG